jgi:putative membrane protein
MAAVIAVSAYRPEKTYDWFLENALVFLFLGTMTATFTRMQFSELSYLLLFAFLAFHEWGAHYKYSDVPLGEWLKPLLSTHRNHYDRVIHFSFGLLCAYPMQEFLLRVVNIRPGWRYVFPVEMTLALSASYELMEAGMAAILTPERGEEFVGMQGDIWDAQKDMFLACLGAVAAMILVASARKRRAALRAARSEHTLTFASRTK